jgi:hypothetical protein
LKKKLLKKQNLRLKINSYSKQNLTEKITVVLFIGAILSSLLTAESLEARKAGVKKRSFPNIIEDIVDVVFALGIYLGITNSV